MCFVLSIATEKPVDSIPPDEQDPELSTQDLAENDAGVTLHTYCGFGSVYSPKGEWPEAAHP